MHCEPIWPNLAGSSPLSQAATLSNVSVVPCPSVSYRCLSLGTADRRIERARNRVRPISLTGRLGVSDAIVEACVLDSAVRALGGSEQCYSDRINVEMTSGAKGAAVVLVAATESIGRAVAPVRPLQPGEEEVAVAARDLNRGRTDQGSGRPAAPEDRKRFCRRINESAGREAHNGQQGEGDRRTRHGNETLPRRQASGASASRAVWDGVRATDGASLDSKSE